MLFASEDELPKTVAVVHLAWTFGSESNSRLPHTDLFESVEDWVERGMMVDHGEFVWLRWPNLPGCSGNREKIILD